MSGFNKPHSYPGLTVIKRNRPRQYPYILRTSKYFGECQCEACDKRAGFTVEYEPNKDSIELSTIFLCFNHEKLTRYGKFDQVFRDMNRKIEGLEAK